MTTRKRAQPHKELRSRARQQETVAHFSQFALTALAIESLVTHVVMIIPQILEVELCRVLEHQNDGMLRHVAGIGWKQAIVDGFTIKVDRTSQPGYTLLTKSR